MRCLLVSDLHYSLKQFDWVIDAASNFDVVVIAGDHIDISGSVDGSVQTAVVLKYFRRIRSQAELIVCSGNHDLDSHNAAGEKFASWIMKAGRMGISTDGDTYESEGALFTVCPWWDGPQSRDEVAALLKRDSAKRNGGPWIWVYHSPPDESPTSLGLRKSFGDTDLGAWIKEHSPDIVMTGHTHESPFCQDGSWADRIGSTWVFNAGRQIGPIPTHIVLDTADQSAFWFSFEGAEIVKLDRDLVRPIPPLTEFPAWFK